MCVTWLLEEMRLKQNAATSDAEATCRAGGVLLMVMLWVHVEHRMLYSVFKDDIDIGYNLGDVFHV